MANKRGDSITAPEALAITAPPATGIVVASPRRASGYSGSIFYEARSDRCDNPR